MALCVAFSLVERLVSGEPSGGSGSEAAGRQRGWPPLENTYADPAALSRK
jgi:hypothetical protein